MRRAGPVFLRRIIPLLGSQTPYPMRLGSAGDDSLSWLDQESAAGRADLFTIRDRGALIAEAIILRHRGHASGVRADWEPTLRPLASASSW